MNIRRVLIRACRKSKLSPAIWKAVFFLNKRKMLEQWPDWAGEVCGIELPGKNGESDKKARISILLKLLKKTAEIPGQIAECGVFQGATLIPIGYQAGKSMPLKKVYAFDSFTGFDEKIKNPIDQAGKKSLMKRVGGFSDTSCGYVEAKIKAFNLGRMISVFPGFFEDTLSEVRKESFSFVHLDCDLYESYKTCLSFFYPRMTPGGIILFDEYQDSVWPGGTKAVDEFFSNKPEKCSSISWGETKRYYLIKQ